MYQFIESIHCKDGVIQNLSFHQSRVDETLGSFHPGHSINLENSIDEIPQSGRHKCRIVYNSIVKDISFHEYHIKHIRTLKLITDDNIDYKHKFLDRQSLDRLYAKRDNCDDVIIVQNDQITDSYYANLAFFRDGKWFTPATTLLNGTKRQSYLNKGMLTETEISPADIKLYSKVSLINAMLDLGEVRCNTDNIIQ